EAAATMVAKGIKDRPINIASPQSVCLKKTEAVAAATMLAKGMKGRPRRNSAPAVIVID
ncbi:hypothetical protein A2U01_0068514, partial [Trifolium medium]|nr:hypothetical protein [Trifolium medium]